MVTSDIWVYAVYAQQRPIILPHNASKNREKFALSKIGVDGIIYARQYNRKWTNLGDCGKNKHI